MDFLRRGVDCVRVVEGDIEQELKRLDRQIGKYCIVCNWCSTAFSVKRGREYQDAPCPMCDEGRLIPNWSSAYVPTALEQLRQEQFSIAALVFEQLAQPLRSGVDPRQLVFMLERVERVTEVISGLPKEM